MRIIAGEFRHRILLTNPGLTTRPITDRAKVKLFDRLERRLKGANVADIYAGSGTMGFESISRGAARAVMCERDSRAFQLLKANGENLRATDRLVCWCVDVLRCSFKPKNAEAFFPYHVVFFDPPYADARWLSKGTPLFKSLERLAKPEVSTSDAQLVLRIPVDCEPELPAGWSHLDDELVVGSMRIQFRTKRSAEPAEDDVPTDDPTVADGDCEAADELHQDS